MAAAASDRQASGGNGMLLLMEWVPCMTPSMDEEELPLLLEEEVVVARLKG